MYKLLLRPLFFAFDPEKIHHFTFSLIKFTILHGKLIEAIDATKDVDGFTYDNIGKFVLTGKIKSETTVIELDKLK